MTIWPKGGSAGLNRIAIKAFCFPMGPKRAQWGKQFGRGRVTLRIPGDPWPLDPENRPLNSSQYIVYLISELTPGSMQSELTTLKLPEA